MKKKYELTDETIIKCGRTLHRIRALRDFADVEAGDLGGYVETDGSLSHDGDVWLYGGYVFQRARLLYGRFRGGDFHGGTFRGGWFRGDTFHGGEFLGGDCGWFRGGDFHGGDFHGGTFHDGEFLGGVFLGGVFHDGTFHGGWFLGGEFHGSPLQIQGSRHFVNVSSPTTLQIGCYNKTFAAWKKEFIEIGQKHCYTEAEIAEYKSYINLAARWIKANKHIVREAE